MSTRDHFKKSAIAPALLWSVAMLLGSTPVFAEEEGGDGDNGPNFMKHNGYGGGATIPQPPFPAGLNVFDLTLEQTREFSYRHNYQVVGHSYFKGPWLTPSAVANGQGAGFNTPPALGFWSHLGNHEHL